MACTLLIKQLKEPDSEVFHSIYIHMCYTCVSHVNLFTEYFEMIKYGEDRIFHIFLFRHNQEI